MDTRAKRASALGFTLAALVVLPAPDGTVAQADRQQVAFSYGGIAAATPIAIDVDSSRTWTVDARATIWTVTARTTIWAVDTRSTTWTVE